MKCVVCGAGEAADAVLSRLGAENVSMATDLESCAHHVGADVFLFLDERFIGADLSFTAKPVLVHSPFTTLDTFFTKADNIFRFNALPAFLQNKAWECASYNRKGPAVELPNVELLRCPDIPGFISFRVIACIINEAHFALEEGVATIDAIDRAMRLGTAYPYGPFEWEKKIGAGNILRLLRALAASDKKYSPATTLAHDNDH